MKTSDKILASTRDILAEGGIGAVSFDAIARRLGLSKQAVLYWYPSKQELLAELFLGWLKAEAEACIAALEGVEGQGQAVAGFVRALAGFHLGNLDRFRAMYLIPQTLRQAGQERPDAAIMERIHATSSQTYAALARHLPGEALQARQQAVAIHAAVLGLAVMAGLAEATGDPLKHAETDLVAALVARLVKEG